MVLLLGCGASPPAAVNKPARSVTATPSRVPTRIDLVRPVAPGGATPAPVLDDMADELRRSMTELGKHADPPYFGSFEVTDTDRISVDASFGALRHSSEARSRSLDVDVRVGDYKLDNTHSTRSRRSRREWRYRHEATAHRR